MDAQVSANILGDRNEGGIIGEVTLTVSPEIVWLVTGLAYHKGLD